VASVSTEFVLRTAQETCLGYGGTVQRQPVAQPRQLQWPQRGGLRCEERRRARPRCQRTQITLQQHISRCLMLPSNEPCRCRVLTTLTTAGIAWDAYPCAGCCGTNNQRPCTCAMKLLVSGRMWAFTASSASPSPCTAGLPFFVLSSKPEPSHHNGLHGLVQTLSTVLCTFHVLFMPEVCPCAPYLCHNVRRC
jgi:hypothetical protein